MKIVFIAASLFLIIMEGFAQNIKTEGKLLVNNPLIHKIIPEDAQIEILAGGFEWTEGPLWLENLNKLLFSDIPQNSIFEWSEKEGTKLYLKPSGYTGKITREGEMGSNGLLLNPQGELILCQHGDRRIAKMVSLIDNPKAEFQTLANNYEGKKLNSPNDAVYRKSGDLYFTDPPYGLELLTDDPAKELDFQGVYKTDKSGNTVLLTAGLSRPNGLAFSPGESKLYVANSDSLRALWMVYEVTQSGLLENGKVFYDITAKTSELKGLPDGMKVHPNGWVFATGPGGVLVFTPEGEHLGTIYTGEKTANCTFNADYSSLYMTADDYLLRLKLKKQDHLNKD
jgi:gluconolactonase